MTIQDKLIKKKFSLLELSEFLHNVSEAFWILGTFSLFCVSRAPLHNSEFNFTSDHAAIYDP